jgi:peptide/nickel transport system permease protein
VPGTVAGPPPLLPAQPAVPAIRRPRRAPWRDALVRPGALVLAAVVIVVALVPLLPGFDPYRVDLDALLLSPGLAHPLGTDENGRDALARLIEGGRVSLGVGAAGAALAVLIGTVVGMIAGTQGGMVDALLMRFVDVALAFPSIFLIIMFTAVFSTGVLELIVLIGVTGWMGLSRLIRGQVRELHGTPFIEAARALGAHPVRVLTAHMLPNLGPVLAVTGLTQVNRAVLAEATLSFLGIGIRPPMPSWGNMLMDAQNYLWTAPWLALGPGCAITLVLLALSTLADRTRLR